MIRATITATPRLTVALLAVLAGASCNEADAPSAPVDSPAASDAGDTIVTFDTLAPVDTTTSALASVTYTGLPFGAIGLWASATTLEWGPAMLTLSQDNTFANSVVTRINTARQKRQRLVMAMTGGPSSDFTTNGRFDLAKWKKRMNTFKTSTIRNAIANGVADGTVVGNTLIDEPETPKWGGNVTKSMIDGMAAYAKQIFPTLPMGINQGGPGYRWRTGERFHKLDYVLAQYQWTATEGDIGAWREAVINRARIDGVRPAFSLNLLNGGIPDRSGSWDCRGTGGKGTRSRMCRMTADQVKNWGRAVGPSGCLMLMWRYDGAFMSKSANQDAFRSVASLLASQPRRSCRRL